MGCNVDHRSSFCPGLSFRRHSCDAGVFMKRRGVLGLIGGAVAAGPSMAKTAIASGMEAMSLGQTASSLGLVSAGINYAGQTQSGPSTPYDPLSWAKRDLAKLIGKTVEQIAKEKAQIEVGYLDPDLAANRSMSLDAKVRVMKGRIWHKNQDRERGWIELRIEEIISGGGEDIPY